MKVYLLVCSILCLTLLPLRFTFLQTFDVTYIKFPFERVLFSTFYLILALILKLSIFCSEFLQTRKSWPGTLSSVEWLLLYWVPCSENQVCLCRHIHVDPPACWEPTLFPRNDSRQTGMYGIDNWALPTALNSSQDAAWANGQLPKERLPSAWIIMFCFIYQSLGSL